MMSYESAGRHNGFKVRIRGVFRRQSHSCHLIRVAANSHIYTSGQKDATVYLIESGRVKLVLPTLDGTSCLLAVRMAGDILGELCLSGNAIRQETAIAMRDTVLRQISRGSFLANLKQKPSLRPLLLHLASCVAEQQEMAATLTSETDEQRMAEYLLRLGWNFAENDSCSICSEQRLSQEYLAEMVGTSRSRIGAYLEKFHERGLISVNNKGRLVVREDRLSDYIARVTFGARIDTVHSQPRSSGIAERFRLPSALSCAPVAAVCSI